MECLAACAGEHEGAVLVSVAQVDDSGGCLLGAGESANGDSREASLQERFGRNPRGGGERFLGGQEEGRSVQPGDAT